MERQNLLSYKPKPTANKAVLPFVMTYHLELPKVRDVVDKHWSIIESSDHLSTVFPQKPIMAFRRPKSLRDHLVWARLKPDPIDDEPLGECKPCGRSRCQTCKMITPSQTATSSSGARVKLKGDTNCRTHNVVYLISCGKCGKQYVGETKGPLNIRMNGHRDDWRHKRFERSPVGEHFCSSGHDFISHASVCCLESNPGWTDNARKSHESYWIRRLNTLNPSGINKGDKSLTPFQSARWSSQSHLASSQTHSVLFIRFVEVCLRVFFSFPFNTVSFAP